MCVLGALLGHILIPKRWYKLVECGERNKKVATLGKNEGFCTNHVKFFAWVQMKGTITLCTTQITYGPDWSQKERPQLEKLRNCKF